ncbi:MAG: response regulator [Isosphaeraceae bacterium]|nr:response regulator [Isosphaeraceae bacterium]
MSEHDPNPAHRPRRILLVDDNADGRKAMTKVLALQGFEVTDVPDGASALEALATGPPFDIILIDMLLPDIDGRDVARQVRDLKLDHHPYVALITGWSFEADPQELADCGIDQVFLKPVDIHELVKRLPGGAGGPGGA